MAFCFADYERSAQALRAKIGDFVPQVALIPVWGSWGIM